MLFEYLSTLMVILPVTGGQSGKLTDAFQTQKGHQGQHPQRLLGIFDTLLVSFGYYFIKKEVVGCTIGAVRLHPLSIANFRVKGLTSGILVQRRDSKSN